MATFINRSQYTVRVLHKPALMRDFPHSELAAAREYLQELREQGHPARLEQGDEHWYVRIRKKGYPELSFDGGRYEDAKAAVARIEAERKTGLFIDYTSGHRACYAELFERYVKEVCPDHKACDVEQSVLESFLTDLGGEHAERAAARKRERALARVAGAKKKPRILPSRHKPRDKKVIAWLLLPLAQVKPTAINDYIRDRLADVEAPTADREIDLLSQVTTWAMKTLRIELHRSPLYGVKRPSYFNERSRLLKGDEEQRLLEAAREEDRLLAPELALERFQDEVAKLPNASARKRRLRHLHGKITSGAIAAPVVPYFETFIQFLLLTASRRSEALALKWADVDFKAGCGYLPDSKNGRPRNIMLRQQIIEMLKRLPRTGERVFPLTLNQVREAWNCMVKRAQLDDFHMHDLRHVALTVMCQVARAAGVPLTLHELATISGHRDLRTLGRYLNLCSGELARRIDEAHQIAHAEAKAVEKRKAPSPFNHKGRARVRIRVSSAALVRDALSESREPSCEATADEALAAEAANTLPI
jgi:integrase